MCIIILGLRSIQENNYQRDKLFLKPFVTSQKHLGISKYLDEMAKLHLNKSKQLKFGFIL